MPEYSNQTVTLNGTAHASTLAEAREAIDDMVTPILGDEPLGRCELAVKTIDTLDDDTLVWSWTLTCWRTRIDDPLADLPEDALRLIDRQLDEGFQARAIREVRAATGWSLPRCSQALQDHIDRRSEDHE